MQTDYEAIIIGAGPAGSTAAILLADAGWSVALVEKQRFPRRKVCGECIAASNLPLLDALGVGDAFANIAGPELKRVALMSGAHTVCADLPASDDVKHRWGRALGREHLDTLLLRRAAAAGAAVWQPWSAQSLDGGPGGFRCSVRDVDSGKSVTLRAPFAIDAHGSWEPLSSDRARRRAQRRANDLFGFKANFRNANLAAGLLPVLSFRGGYGGMVVAGDGIMTLACCIRADRLNACRRASPGAKAGEIVESYLSRECEGVQQALNGARQDGPWLASGPIFPGVHLPSGRDGVFLIGNAAGEAHPIIGEGMSMAMQSAWLLCEYLVRRRYPLLFAAAGRERQRLMQTHHAMAWRAHFAPRIRLSALFAHAAMRPAVSLRLLPVLRRWPMLVTQGARWSGKVRCAPNTDAIALLAPSARSLTCSARSSLHAGAACRAQSMLRESPSIPLFQRGRSNHQAGIPPFDKGGQGGFEKRGQGR